MTDSVVRDADEMRAAGFQALYRDLGRIPFLHPRDDYGKPVIIDGVSIAPGDLLQIDQHGALIVPIETCPISKRPFRRSSAANDPVIDYAKAARHPRGPRRRDDTSHPKCPKWTPGQSS